MEREEDKTEETGRKGNDALGDDVIGFLINMEIFENTTTLNLLIWENGTFSTYLYFFIIYTSHVV